MPIRTPLPHIPVHIVQPPRIRLLCPYVVNFTSAVAITPCHLINCPSREWTRLASPARIFPLRLRWQGYLPAFGNLSAPIHLIHEFLGVIP